MDSNYEGLLSSVLQTLEKNGFPGKRVALPLERMYEVAHKKGLNFNKALQFLEERGVHHEKTSERIIFFCARPADSSDDLRKAMGDLNPESLKNLDMSEMMRRAGELIQKMSPEDLRRMEEMFAGLSDAEKEEMARKAKEMGIM